MTPDDIIEVVADRFGYRPEDFRHPSRIESLAFARQIAMYLCRELTDLSFPAIGKAFHRDHSTVMYAHRKISEQLNWWRGLGFHVAAIRDELQNGREVTSGRPAPAGASTPD